MLVDRYPDDFYLTDDLTDHAIAMIRESKASNPDKPFFLYFAHGAVHAPLHAKAADIARYRGRYHAGWDDLRHRRHARQLELGVIPPGTPLAPRNTETDHDVTPWDELTDAEREALRPSHGGLRGHGGRGRPERRSAARRPRRAGRAATTPS